MPYQKTIPAKKYEPSKYPELDEKAKCIAAYTIDTINIVAPKIESKMIYKAQYLLEKIIEELKKRV